MKTILVTGGAGFIGSNFIRMMLSPDMAIVNFDALTYASSLESLKEFEDNPNYTFCKADICDAKAVGDALRTYTPDYIVHFAAQSHVDRSIDNPRPFIDTNIVGTFTLLDEVRRWDRPDGFRFIHVSTDEVYGSTIKGRLFTEDTAYDPSSPYSASKAASDHIARAYYRTYGVPIIVTNCSNNYGPYQFPEKLIPLMILNGLEGKKLPVYGTGQNIRDWIHVDDHVRALWCVISKGELGETYNIGADCRFTNLEVVHLICDSFDAIASIGWFTDIVPPSGNYRELVEFVGDRPGHDMMYAVDSRKMRSLGWTPTVAFDLGLCQTIQWYHDNRDWITQIYDRRRLGNA